MRYVFDPVSDKLMALIVDVSSIWETKLAAICCRATQWNPSPMVLAPEERQQHFFGRKYFMRAASRHVNADFMSMIF